MKKTRYVGTFIYEKLGIKHEYTFTVDAFGFTQAFFVLTSKAISKGRVYQLEKIVDEYNETKYVNEIEEMNIFKTQKRL